MDQGLNHPPPTKRLNLSLRAPLIRIVSSCTTQSQSVVRGEKTGSSRTSGPVRHTDTVSKRAVPPPQIAALHTPPRRSSVQSSSFLPGGYWPRNLLLAIRPLFVLGVSLPTGSSLYVVFAPRDMSILFLTLYRILLQLHTHSNLHISSRISRAPRLRTLLAAGLVDGGTSQPFPSCARGGISEQLALGLSTTSCC